MAPADLFVPRGTRVLVRFIFRTKIVIEYVIRATVILSE